MIEQERIEAVKTDVDLKACIESRGIALKKNGKGYMGLCPFHNDTNPSLSVNIEKQLFQCFGCGTAGDVIRFVQLYDKVDFKEAVRRLTTPGITVTTESPPAVKPATKKPSSQKTSATQALSVKDKKLLARVVGYYQHTLTEDRRGLDYLAHERGIADTQSLKDFGAGYANGTLLEILPEDPEVIAALKRIGILNAKGHEVFYNCVVFPLHDANGAIVNLYGRNITDDNGVTHLYLPGSRSGLVNRQAVKRSQTLLLTELIIDALTLYDQGFKNVMPIYGTNGLLDEHLSFFNRRVKEAYLVFDADEAGRKAAESLVGRLKEKEIAAYPVALPVKDVNVYFKRHTPEAFEALLKSANPQSLEQSDKVNTRKQSLYKETAHGFIVGYGDRQYEIKGIQRGDTQLKVTIKASTEVAGDRPFELTTIDLYSSRSRAWFAKLCADLFGADEALVKEDIGRILKHVEDWQPQKTESHAEKPSEDEKARALQFLKNPDLFAEVLADLATIGVTGEETNKLVGYLAAVSRKLDDPLSVLIQSRSAAGKSTLQDAILSLVPDEDYAKYTRITDQALFYKEEDALVNKILAIEEEAGMGGAAYSIRNIQSSKKITVAATGKDPGTGRMKTEEYTVRGPVAVMITTTAAELEGETASRFLFLTIDESAKMTDAIHRMVRETAEQLQCPIEDVFFTRRMIREYINWTDWQVRAHIRQLEELEYLYARVGAKGKEYAYALNYRGQAEETGRCYLNLTPVEEIRKLMRKDKD